MIPILKAKMNKVLDSQGFYTSSGFQGERFGKVPVFH